MSLNISLSCEIENLMNEIMAKTDKSYDDVEKAVMKAGIYPDSTKTFISWNDDKTKKSIIVKFTMQDHPELKWLDEILVLIFKENNIDSIYITHAI